MIDRLLYDEIENHEVVDDVAIPTGHRPIALSVKLNIIELRYVSRQNFTKRLAWYKASQEDIKVYIQ